MGALTNGSPHLPVLNTSPFPRAVTHKLSKAFGNTYIANSPLRLFSSTNNDSPAAKPANQKDVLETKKSMIYCGIFDSGLDEVDGDSFSSVKIL